MTDAASPTASCPAATGCASRVRVQVRTSSSTSPSIGTPVIARRSAATVRSGSSGMSSYESRSTCRCAGSWSASHCHFAVECVRARALIPRTPSSTRAPVPRGALSSSTAVDDSGGDRDRPLAQRGACRGRGRGARRARARSHPRQATRRSHPIARRGLRARSGRRRTPRHRARNTARRCIPPRRPATCDPGGAGSAQPRHRRTERAGVAQGVAHARTRRGQVRGRRRAWSRPHARPARRAAAGRRDPIRRRTRAPTERIGLRMPQGQNRVEPGAPRGESGRSRRTTSDRARVRGDAEQARRGQRTCAPAAAHEPCRRFARPDDDRLPSPSSASPAPRPLRPASRTTRPPRRRRFPRCESTRAGRRCDRMPRRPSPACRRARGRARRPDPRRPRRSR